MDTVKRVVVIVVGFIAVSLMMAMAVGIGSISLYCGAELIPRLPHLDLAHTLGLVLLAECGILALVFAGLSVVGTRLTIGIARDI